MQGFKQVITFVYNMSLVQLNFGQFHFSIFQVWVGMIAMTLVITFIKRVFLD